MIKEAFGTGATLEEAKERAIKALNAPEDALVQFEVVEREKKKLFGIFGGSEARIRAYYEAADEKSETPVKEEKSITAKKEKKEKVEKSAPEKKEKKEKTEKPAKVEPENVGKVDTSDEVIDYLTDLIRAMQVGEVIVTGYTDASNTRHYSINSDSEEVCGILIGHRGGTLDAFQHLARLVSNKAGKNYARVTINVGDYREKRTENLRALAARNARIVLKNGRNFVLEPMNPYERRIIHTAIGEIEGVSSHSVGGGDGRRVVITPDGESEKKPAPKKAKKAKTQKNVSKADVENTALYGKIGGSGNSEKEKPAEKPVEHTPKAPQTEAVTSTALYGKITPKK
ncbi:MAG TPA: KH domain-containing protein [Clostridiales bacterium]|nr:KH domain-containing protein [Clostridiales bacterium]